jgi:hypothetical protein
MSQKGDPKIAPTVPQFAGRLSSRPIENSSRLTLRWRPSQRERNQKFLRADRRKPRGWRGGSLSASAGQALGRSQRPGLKGTMRKSASNVRDKSSHLPARSCFKDDAGCRAAAGKWCRARIPELSASMRKKDGGLRLRFLFVEPLQPFQHKPAPLSRRAQPVPKRLRSMPGSIAHR